MNCPKCNTPLDPALIMHASQSEIASKPRSPTTACERCGKQLTKRQAKRRPTCPHEGKRK